MLHKFPFSKNFIYIVIFSIESVLMESVSPNVSVSSMADDTLSNDSIDGQQNVQLPDDEDDFRSLMDEIGIVVPLIYYYGSIYFLIINFFLLFRKVAMMNQTII